MKISKKNTAISLVKNPIEKLLLPKLFCGKNYSEANDLEAKYGRNFNEKNVRRMLPFAEQFADFEIVVPLARQLSWSHFLLLIPLKEQASKLFYAQLSINDNYSVRDLRKQIVNKTFERTEIANIQISANRPELMNTFKDPYVLDFLNLKNKMELILLYLLGSIAESKKLEKEMESNLKSLRYE